MFHQYKYTATFWTGIKQHRPILSISTSCQLHYLTGIYDDSTKINKLYHANVQHVMILNRWSAAEGHQSFLNVFWWLSFLTQCWDIFKILSFFHSPIFDSENIYQIRDKTKDEHDTFTWVNYPNNFPVTCFATVNVYWKWDINFFYAFAALFLTLVHRQGDARHFICLEQFKQLNPHTQYDFVTT